MRDIQRAVRLEPHLTHSIEDGGDGYHILWFTQIARQHPVALERRDDLRKIVQRIEDQHRGFFRGRREFKAGYPRYDNPYCGYTQCDLYEAWHAGWDRANNDANRRCCCNPGPTLNDGGSR
jgi:hypothetical protein